MGATLLEIGAGPQLVRVVMGSGADVTAGPGGQLTTLVFKFQHRTLPGAGYRLCRARFRQEELGAYVQRESIGACRQELE